MMNSKKALARSVFILIPAFVLSLPVFVHDDRYGVIMFCAVCALGFSATERRPERGE